MHKFIDFLTLSIMSRHSTALVCIEPKINEKCLTCFKTITNKSTRRAVIENNW